MPQTPVQHLIMDLPARLNGRVNFVWKREQTCEQTARDKEGKAEREAATVSDGSSRVAYLGHQLRNVCQCARGEEIRLRRRERDGGYKEEDV